MTLKFDMVRAVVKIHVRAKYHQAECCGSWVIVHTSFFALSRNGKKNPKIRFCDLDLWPITLKFSAFRAVVKVHVPAKFHQDACSGSWVIVVTKKKISDDNNTVRRYPADSNCCAMCSAAEPDRLRLCWCVVGVVGIALGMQTGAILDCQLSASESPVTGQQANDARLAGPSGRQPSSFTHLAHVR